MLRKGIISILVVSLVMAMGSISFAALETSGKSNPGDKLAKGAINLLTGWTELPQKIGDTFAKKEVGNLLTEGLFKGVFSAISRTVAGAVDVVTFLVPPYDKPMMEPMKSFVK